MVWYSSGKFNSMRVVISELSIFMSGFHRSPLSIYSLAIHYSRFFVTSSSLFLRNILRSLVLKAPVVCLIFLKFSYTIVLRLFTHYFCSFLLKQSENRPCLLVWVPVHCKLSCWVASINKLLLFLSAPSAGIFLSLVIRTSYTLILATSTNFYDHTYHYCFHL